jgi:hypothetical protein
MFVLKKLFQTILTNTGFVPKFLNYGQKKFYNMAPERRRTLGIVVWEGVFSEKKKGVKLINEWTALLAQW